MPRTMSSVLLLWAIDLAIEDDWICQNNSNLQYFPRQSVNPYWFKFHKCDTCLRQKCCNFLLISKAIWQSLPSGKLQCLINFILQMETKGGRRAVAFFTVFELIQWFVICLKESLQRLKMEFKLSDSGEQI